MPHTTANKSSPELAVSAGLREVFIRRSPVGEGGRQGRTVINCATSLQQLGQRLSRDAPANA
jgi:hypothetical protein